MSCSDHEEVKNPGPEEASSCSPVQGRKSLWAALLDSGACWMSWVEDSFREYRDASKEWIVSHLPFIPAVLLSLSGLALLVNRQLALVLLALFLLSCGVGLFVLTRLAYQLRDRFERVKGQIQAKVFVGGVPGAGLEAAGFDPDLFAAEAFGEDPDFDEDDEDLEFDSVEEEQAATSEEGPKAEEAASEEQSFEEAVLVELGAKKKVILH